MAALFKLKQARKMEKIILVQIFLWGQIGGENDLKKNKRDYPNELQTDSLQ